MKIHLKGDQKDLFQGCQDDWTINQSVIDLKLKNKSHIIISTDAGKIFVQNSKFIHDKNSPQNGYTGKCFNITKTISPQLTSYSHSSVKKWSTSSESGTRWEYPFWPLLFNTILEVLTTAIKQEKEIKGIQIRKEEVKLVMFADVLILCIENPSDISKNILINEFCNVLGYKINTQKSVAYLHTNTESARKIKKTMLFIIMSKRIKYPEIKLSEEIKRPVLGKLYNTGERNQRNTNNRCFSFFYSTFTDWRSLYY